MKVSLHLLIALTGLISVLLHILYSPAPFASMTKFTIHANLFITLTFSVSAVTMLLKRTESKLLDFCKNASLIYILVGLLTYHFLLSSLYRTSNHNKLHAALLNSGACAFELAIF